VSGFPRPQKNQRDGHDLEVRGAAAGQHRVIHRGLLMCCASAAKASVERRNGGSVGGDRHGGPGSGPRIGIYAASGWTPRLTEGGACPEEKKQPPLLKEIAPLVEELSTQIIREDQASPLIPNNGQKPQLLVHSTKSVYCPSALAGCWHSKIFLQRYKWLVPAIHQNPVAPTQTRKHHLMSLLF
jgi:hypothetical protein